MREIAKTMLVRKEAERKMREEQFPKDLAAAYEIGQKLCGK